MVKRNQAETDKHVNRLKSNIKALQDEKETLQLDIDQLHEDFENKLDMIADMDNDLDMLERESRKATIRIFGLAEELNESRENAKRIVTDNVLKVACEGEDWNPDDLQRAYRVGESRDDQPRIMIATFRYSDDKYRIYAGRDKLREKGIRVSDDLTRRQRKKLLELKEKGYSGYFYKGQVHTRRKKVKGKHVSKGTSMARSDQTGLASGNSLNFVKRRRLGGATDSVLPSSSFPTSSMDISSIEMHDENAQNGTSVLDEPVLRGSTMPHF